MKEKLLPLEELKEEFIKAGFSAFIEYPHYLQIEEFAFGHSLAGDNSYTWNDETGHKSGEIANLPHASQVVEEFIKQTKGA